MASERILRFPERQDRRGEHEDVLEVPDLGQPVVERPRRRARRQQATSPESMPRYMLTALAFFLAVAALGFLLLQLGQLGKQPPAATPVATVVAPVQSAAVEQPAPGGQAAASPQQAALPAAAPGQGTIRTTSKVVEASYAVQSGETLGSIAAKFGTTVDALQSINNLQDRNSLSIGQKLVIPNQN